MPPAEPPASNDATLHVEGEETSDGSIPADVLLRLVQSLQETAYLVGASRESRVVRERLRLDAGFRERYELRFPPSTAGSYVLPMRSRLEELPLASGDGTPGPFLAHLMGVIGAVAHGNRQELQALMPDSRLRDRAIRSVRSLAPPAGRGYDLTFQHYSLPPFVVDSEVQRRADDLLAELQDSSAVTTVTGELRKIDFKGRELSLHYAPANRLLRCPYAAELEEDILRARSAGPLQITGVFELDEEGHPKEVVSVMAIQGVDLSPMHFQHLTWNGRRFEISPPLALQPNLDDDTGQLYVAEDAGLDIHVFARTREQLAEELAGQIAFCVDVYAHADDAALDTNALRLARAYRARVREGAA